jgi:NAD(P)-dependent dehydrogenase (short-subunit alcohol dehydrogenase family)
MRLSGKVAVITGGARGFGAAAAELFAAEGASVVITDLLEDDGGAVVGRIRDAGGRAEFVQGDVTDEGDVARVIETALASFGKLDVCVANAGIFLPGKLEAFEEADYYRQIDVNVKGAWLTCKHALPAMQAGGSGSIVITASGGALRGSRNSALYSASKGAVLLLGKSLALQTATEGIRCNIVCPGPVATDLYRLGGMTPEQYAETARNSVPMGRVGDPVDVAYAMLFFASDESKFCTGSVLSVDGGLTA